jgi:ribose transport system permease protein
VSYVGRWPATFTDLARAKPFGIPALVLWMLGTVLAAYFLIKWTRTGARMTATGEAGESARLAGINIRAMKSIGLALSGMCAGLAAVLLTSSLSSAAPNMAGDYFLYAIAAVLLGMTMFNPGHANIPGTLVAALILKVLGNGLVLMGAPYYVQDIVLGFIMIASVAVSSAVLKKAAFKF